jgi:hypothetical protein
MRQCGLHFTVPPPEKCSGDTHGPPTLTGPVVRHVLGWLSIEVGCLHTLTALLTRTRLLPAIMSASLRASGLKATGRNVARAPMRVSLFHQLLHRRRPAGQPATAMQRPSRLQQRVLGLFQLLSRASAAAYCRATQRHAFRVTCMQVSAMNVTAHVACICRLLGMCEARGSLA